MIEKPGSRTHDCDEQNFLYRVAAVQAEAIDRGEEKKIDRSCRHDTRKESNTESTDP
jgi:hypothetical protein